MPSPSFRGGLPGCHGDARPGDRSLFHNHRLQRGDILGTTLSACITHFSGYVTLRSCNYSSGLIIVA